MSYRVFKRKNWRKEGNKYVPVVNKGQTVRHVETAAEARAICMAANKDRPAYGTKGYYSFVWHEFTEE
jgi:hypothetical protein